MSRPGVDVVLLDTPGAVSAPSDTGTWFVTGLTDRGPIDGPYLCQTLNDFINTFGQRQSYSVLYDCIDTFFREGGNRVYVSRVVGPAAAAGNHDLLDSGASVSLHVGASGPGAWSANYKVGVVAGIGAGTYNIQITDVNNNIVEQSGDLPDQNSAVVWSQNSVYTRITLGVSANNPAVASPVAFTAGTDDRTNATDTQWQAALDRFTSDLGPGQVSAPGRTSATSMGQIVNHVTANKRVGLLDLPDTSAVATLTSAAAGGASRYTASFAPWVTIPGLVINTVRSVPPSALVAGLIARNDPALGPNRPSAGNAGVSRYGIDLSQPSWTDANRLTLNTGGVNVIRQMFGGIRVYGWRSLTNPNSDVNWIDFGNARLYMSIVSDLEVVGENYMFEEIDGQNGLTINGFHDGLTSVMMDYFNTGQLFGDTAAEAFFVDTGPTVNTLATIQNLELHANVYVKMAPFAEWIQIQIVKRQVTQTII